MNSMPISVMIFGAFPEAILMLWAGLLLMGERPNIKKVIGVAIFQGITSYFIKQYADFDMYTIIWISTFILYTHWITRVKWKTSFFAILISSAIVCLLEGSVFIFMNINPIYLHFVAWKSILLLLPHEMVLIFIIYFVHKKNVSLVSECN
ncbi:hypothetical protein [Inediibacterium massiliense]|uniref:hypothetical protein n=1 Tax=Inediibacterium massiliense TaxID=1658111 RepID=UPI0006B63259|nr:hypothetical protein [Inediibacterium massiliense]